MEPHPQVLAVAQRLVAELGWSGIANIDFRVDEAGQPHVLEINGRYWATLLGSTLAGVNFPDLVCRRALGEEVDRPPVAAGTFMQARRWLAELSRGRWRSGWTSLSLLLTDPLPELCRVSARPERAV